MQTHTKTPKHFTYTAVVAAAAVCDATNAVAAVTAAPIDTTAPTPAAIASFVFDKPGIRVLVAALSWADSLAVALIKKTRIMIHLNERIIHMAVVNGTFWELYDREYDVLIVRRKSMCCNGTSYSMFV